MDHPFLPVMRSAALAFLNRMLLGGIVVSGTLGGCRAPGTAGALFLPTFHLEESPNLPSRYQREIEMPLSGVPLTIATDPVLDEFDIVNIELVKVDLGLVLLFQFDLEASRKLMRVTASNLGRRMVLLVNGDPVGVRIIDHIVENGNWLTFTELSDDRLYDFVVDLRATLAEIRAHERE